VSEAARAEKARSRKRAMAEINPESVERFRGTFSLRVKPVPIVSRHSAQFQTKIKTRKDRDVVNERSRAINAGKLWSEFIAATRSSREFRDLQSRSLKIDQRRNG
jgi:hypothetical protein